ncbi:hypothetical protein [Noviherbaspirillum sp.]|uniref:hypothetical protein n=1 Tax=Noviherbaspirillum sp. TaxID=1926288 RepID=UPI002D3D3A29|nr:hypothetical protein [Noviherbaspirillum sp.]HZW19939.1 hypothetical protein [Noviherbaspirillum sp.]
MYVEPAWTGFIGGWHAENGCIALAYPKAQPIGEVMTFEKLMSGRNLTECHIFNLVDMSTFRFHFEMEDTGRSKT